MKRRELLNLLVGIESVKDLKGVKLAYARISNKKLIETEIELLNLAIKTSEEFENYEKKRVELCKQYCVKDDKNVPIMVGDKFTGLEDNDKFQNKIKKLGNEFKNVIEDRKKQIDEYNKMLDEDVDFKTSKISLEDVPKDITGKQLESIFLMIED